MMLNLIFNLASVGQCLRNTAAADRQHHVKKSAFRPAVFMYHSHWYHTMKKITNLTLIVAAVFSEVSKLEETYKDCITCKRNVLWGHLLHNGVFGSKL